MDFLIFLLGFFGLDDALREFVIELAMLFGF